MNLSVESGTFAYRKGNNIFEDVNFNVKTGELLAILGPNGAGKTTLLRCITGMLKWNKGQSMLDDENIYHMSERKLWSKMSYVPQAKSASSSYTALENVLIGRSSGLNIFSSPSNNDIEKSLDVMDSMGISYLRDKKCNEISGGELQMVLIARALVSEPEILILDEPESNLDFKNQLIVLDTMSRLVQNGITCIFNTHYPDHALQRADKSLILSGGKTMFGKTSQIVTEENIEKSFGVEAIIGEIETPNNIYHDVLPLRLTRNTPKTKEANPQCIAAITIITDDFQASEKINALLHEYNDIIIGRMGMPYKKDNVFIINTTFDGKKDRINELSHRFSLIPRVSAKTTFAK